jgi:hypothetical protein
MQPQTLDVIINKFSFLFFNHNNMHETLNLICNSLDSLGTAIENATSDNRTLTEWHGWHHPALTRHDLANLSYKLALKIRDNSTDSIDDDYNEILKQVPKRLSIIQGSVLPYFYNGHGHQSIPAYFSTINWVAMLLEPIFGWQVLTDNKAMPNQLAKRLRSISAELSELTPDKDILKQQIKLIQDATATAETLPTDLENLRNSRNKVNQLEKESVVFHSEIEKLSKSADETYKSINSKKEETDKLVELCGEAYRITTTKGLAGAFDKRVFKLSISMWVWVFFLVVALVTGAYIGSNRIAALTLTVQDPNIGTGSIILQIVLSLLSIGAPLWFAWLATKQITQNFRLSEDYAFKASVAKAYEGYRKEAVRIDEAFEARLFSSALTRLEEAPLRLVDHETYGSPWHEFVSSRSFQEALYLIPGFKNKYISSIKGIGKNQNKVESKVDSIDSEEK